LGSFGSKKKGELIIFNSPILFGKVIVYFFPLKGTLTMMRVAWRGIEKRSRRRKEE
jgi:hypothetical protein